MADAQNPFSMPQPSQSQPHDDGQDFTTNTTTEGPFRHGSGARWDTLVLQFHAW